MARWHGTHCDLRAHNGLAHLVDRIIGMSKKHKPSIEVIWEYLGKKPVRKLVQPKQKPRRKPAPAQ